MKTLFAFLLLLISFPALADESQPFNDWLDGFKRQAMSRGISRDVLENAFEGVTEPSQDILERDQSQPESTKSFDEYESGVLSAKKIRAGRENWQSHDELLSRVEDRYGVPIPVLIALWGVESNYGDHQGSFPITHSLATLAYDGRRSAFFRGELMAACRILQEERKSADALTGSWAGAMGQIQFMPTSYLSYAVDFDGDGKRDIWGSDADALASMANYLAHKGWKAGEGWGLRVHLPEDSEQPWWEMHEKKSLGEWRKLGLTLAGGGDLPDENRYARLVLPDADPAVAFLTFSNYDVLLEWNRSTYFATTVGLLADAIIQ